MSKNYMNNSQASEIVKYISDTMKFPIMGAGGGFAPIGVGNWYFGSVAPQGWLICDGTIYNIADYPEFAAFIASNYESANAFGGDGVTTFAVPDCRGEYFRMIGGNTHANQGDGGELGEHQDATVHPNIFSTGNYIQDNRKNSSDSTAVNTDYQYTRSQAVYRGDFTVDATSSGSAQYTSRPTTTCWNFIVKATVSGDANAHQYSTDEQIVGTWVDGKPIYEKTIDWTVVASSSGSAKSQSQVGLQDIPFSSIDKLIDIKGYCEYGGWHWKYGTSSGSNTLIIDWYKPDNTFWIYSFSGLVGKTATLTFQYTKTSS